MIATCGPVEGVETWDLLSFKIASGHPSGMNFGIGKSESSLYNRNGAILISPVPCLDRQADEHKMSRSLIDFGHAAFVYIAEMHGRYWESC